MLQRIKGFEHTAEARKVEAEIENRHSGAALFSNEMPAPAQKQSPAAPCI